MTKKQHHKTLHRTTAALLLAVALTTGGCSKWLDVQPKTELKQEELFSTEQGFYEAMTGAYVTMTDDESYGTELSFGMLSVFGSDYSPESSTPQAVEYLKPVEAFDYTNGNLKNMIAKIWLKQYNTIAQVNAILENIDSKKQLFTGNNYNLVKGEALGLRAFIHFDLLRLFAPGYLTKDNTKYLPYVTRYGRQVTPFSDIDGILTGALKDLNEAEALLVNDPLGKTGTPDRKIRMNLLAVKGLKARIHLYMGNKPAAFEMAKAVIDANNIRLLAPGTTISLDRSFHSEHLFSLYKLNLSDKILNVLTPGTGSAGNNAPYYYTIESKLSGNIYENQSTDIRYKMPMMMVYKGNLTPHKFLYQDIPENTAGMMRYYIPLIRLTEIYYIAAETAPDETTALGYLNKVLASRGLQSLAAGTDLALALKKEYRKEFFAEGQTFFFYKRLNAARIDDSPVMQMTPKLYTLPLPDDEIIYGGR